MRRRRLLAAGALAGLGVAAWLLLLWPRPPRPGVSRDNYERIRPGMAEAEVETLFGEPARLNPRQGGVVWWIGEEGTVFMRLGPGPGKGLVVVGKEFKPAGDRFWDRLREVLPGGVSRRGGKPSTAPEAPPELTASVAYSPGDAHAAATDERSNSGVCYHAALGRRAGSPSGWPSEPGREGPTLPFTVSAPGERTST